MSNIFSEIRVPRDEIPKLCELCPFCIIDGCHDERYCKLTLTQYDGVDKAYDCPLRSIEDLIDKITDN